jgi:hypothetical protein
MIATRKIDVHCMLISCETRASSSRNYPYLCIPSRIFMGINIYFSRCQPPAELGHVACGSGIPYLSTVHVIVMPSWLLHD